MTLDDSILNRLPEYVPKDRIRLDDTVEFEDPADHGTTLVILHNRGYGADLYGGRLYGTNAYLSDTVYPIAKAPFDELRTVTARVNGVRRELTIGTDVRAVDTIGDERFDSIEFINSSTYPDAGSVVEVEYVGEPVISRYTGAYDSDLDDLSNTIDDSIDAKSVTTADDDELSLVGSQFGEIGRRRRRGVMEYRQFLRSVVQAFSGFGTKEDIKFSVAAATGGDPEDVTIIEDTEQVGFEIEISNAGGLTVTQSIEELAEIASPSGVELLRAPTIEVSGGAVTVTGTASTLTFGASLGVGQLGADNLGD